MASQEKTESFRLPPPKFGAETKQSLDSFTKLRKPHFSTPSGMLLPRENQPPPMYGPRGSTVPPWLVSRAQQQQQHHHQYGSKGPTNYHNQRPRGPPHRGGHGGYSNGGFDKEVIPELLQVDWSLWCESCDVNCKTEDELQKHMDEHRNCEVEGCKYVGHPGAMKRHWKLVHDEKKLQEKAHMESKQSPEDIDKWRAERRMRYPSKNNVLKRQHEQEEKFKRGERIEEDKRRFPNKKQQEPRNDKERNFRGSAGKQRHGSKKPKLMKEVVEEPEDSEDEDTKSRIAFKGTSKLKDFKEETTNSLSLLCAYGSDSEECSSSEDEPETVRETIPDSTATAGTILSELEATVSAETVASYLSDGEVVVSETEQEVTKDAMVQEVDQEQCTTEANIEEVMAEAKQPTEEAKTKRKHRTRKRRNGEAQDEPSVQAGPSKITRIEKPLLNYSKLRHARQNTLLEKLLEPDIRHERNVLLQCVRFVVQKDFFGIGQPKPSAPEQSHNHPE